MARRRERISSLCAQPVLKYQQSWMNKLTLFESLVCDLSQVDKTCIPEAAHLTNCVLVVNFLTDAVCLAMFHLVLFQHGFQLMSDEISFMNFNYKIKSL